MEAKDGWRQKTEMPVFEDFSAHTRFSNGQNVIQTSPLRRISPEVQQCLNHASAPYFWNAGTHYEGPQQGETELWNDEGHPEERGSYLLALLQQSFLRKASNIPMQLAWGTYAHWQVKKRKRNPVSLRRWTIHLGPPCCGVQVVKHIWLQSSINIHLSNASHNTPRQKYRTRNPRITGLPFPHRKPEFYSLKSVCFANSSKVLMPTACHRQEGGRGGEEKDDKRRACAH